MKGTTRAPALLSLLVLVLVACGDDAQPGASPTPTDQEAIPTVALGECQTSQGDVPPAEPTGENFNSQLRESGILHVGSDNDYPPFESIPAEGGEPQGFDVDLYAAVAERLQLEPRSTTTSFDALFTQSIPGGQFDIGVSAITITAERKQTVDFTIPYFEADLSLAVNVARTPEIATIEDLSGLTIGAQQGTTGETCANFLVEEGYAAEVKSFDTSTPMFQDLAAGRIAAVVNDRPASQGFIDQNPDLEVVQVIETREQYGFAISKEKPDLRVAINDALTEIMEDGTYAEIYEEWFDTPPPYEVPIR